MRAAVDARIYASARAQMKRYREETRGANVRGCDYVADLALFLREPTMRHCLSAIQNDCLTNDIIFTEGGQAVSDKFHKHLQLPYKTFARECIEYLYTCQFVPWYIERVRGEAVPRTLPLGSFTWQAQFKQEWELREGTWPIKYVLRGLDMDIEKLGVHIFYAVHPLYRAMASPLDTLYEYFCQSNIARSEVAACVKSSLRSLVLVSETVDTKEQTQQGIELLDAARRYNIGGDTGNQYQQRQILTALDTGAVLNNVNEAGMVWLSKIEATHDNLGVSLMPPNSQVTQVSRQVPNSDVMMQLQMHYRMSVHTHFNVRQDSERTATTGAEASHASGGLAEQHNSVLHVSRVLEAFLPQVYAAAFKSTAVVACSLRLVNKLEVNSVADVKVLCECGILGPLEVREMLAVTLTKSKPDASRLVSFAAKPKK